jgi:cytochrome c oxidase assembly protein subunit 15
MNEVDYYNLAPIFDLMGVGLAVAALPLAWWWWRHRTAAPSARLKALTLITLFLTFDLVVFGAFTRLSDSGLGCPDWPGCYGSATPIGAKAEILAEETAMPTGAVTQTKAWIEMVHRYLATGVGVLIITLAAMTWWLRRQSREVSPWLPMLTLAWVCLQGAFGALTVTMKLYPAIVTLHLMFGIGLLALLMTQAVRYDGAGSRPISSGLRWGLWIGFVMIWLQIGLGGWVSTNYAVLACPDFPTCRGQWVPDMNWQGFNVIRELGHTPAGELLPYASLVTIHFVHRAAAVLVVGFLGWVGWRMLRQPGMAMAGRWLLGLSALQFITGMSNVVLGWPLLAALMHTAGAAAMALTLTWALSISRVDNSGFYPTSEKHPA